MTHKKLGLLLLPLVPLSAIGVVSIVNGLIPAKHAEVTTVECQQSVQHFAQPPKPAPPAPVPHAEPPHPPASR